MKKIISSAKEYICISKLIIKFFLFFCVSCGESNMPSGFLAYETPELGMKIARGFDADAKESLRGDCIKNPESFLKSAWSDANGIKAELTETRITSHENLMRELNFSSSASIKYKFYSGNTNFSKYDKFTSSEDTFTWLFSIRAVAGQSTLQLDQIGQENLTDTARKLLINGDKNGFRKLCGTHFIRSVKYGGRISNVLEVSAKASEQIEKIHAEITAGGGIGNWQASLNLNFSKILAEAASRSMLKREYSQEGGKSIHYNLSPESIQATLNDFALSLTENNSVPIEIETSEWSTLLNFDTNSLTDVARQLALQRLYKMIWQNNEKLEKIDQYTYFFENNRANLTSEQIKSLSESSLAIAEQNDEILLRGQACYNDSAKCQLSGITPIPVKFPSLVFNDGATTIISLENWNLNIPRGIELLKIENSTSISSWVSKKPLVAKDASDNLVTADINIIIIPECRNIIEEMRKFNSNILMTSLGEKIPYFEASNEIPNGRYLPAIVFGFPSKSNSCLKLSFISQLPVLSPYKLDEYSEFSRIMRGIAQSVKTN